MNVHFEINLVKTRKAGASAPCYVLIGDISQSYARTFAVKREARAVTAVPRTRHRCSTKLWRLGRGTVTSRGG